MRGLASIQAVDETGVEVYAPNKVTRAFTTVKGISGLDLLYVDIKILCPYCLNQADVYPVTT